MFFRAIVFMAALACVAPSDAAEWTAKSVMSHVDKATKNRRWIKGQVQWNQFLGSSINVDGSGQVWIDLQGRFRAEVAGNNPRTILISPGYVQLYKPLEKVTEVFQVFDQPDLVVQYAVLGFRPRGSELKRDYEVKLVKQEQLDGRQTFLLQLVPKSVEAAEAFPALMLWIDGETWLPAQQMFRQGDGGLQVTIRYQGLSPETELPETLFESNWPEGTKIVRQ